MVPLLLWFFLLASDVVSSLQPFTQGSLSVVRIGVSTLPSSTGIAYPVFIDEYDGATGTLLQSISFPSSISDAESDNNPSTLYPLTLTISDHLEGDLERSNEGCYLSILGYGLEQGNRTTSLQKLLIAGLVNGNGTSIDTSTALNFTGNGYSRADGCVRSPLFPPGQGTNNYNADIFILAGQSSSCSLQLVKQNTTYTTNGTLITDGFAARGLSIAGEDPSTYQLYVGGGRIIRKIGNNGLVNLHTYVIGTPTIQGGTDFGAGWEFANDTLAYIIDKDDNYTDHQGGLHSVHVYTCQNGEGSSNKCPEGGTWSRYGAVTNFSYPCILASGTKKDVWYLAGDFSNRGTPSQPIFYLTTDEGVSISAVYKLDTRTNECTLFIPPQPNVVYRGIAMSPSQAACLPPSPTPSPSSSPSSSPSVSPSSSVSLSSSPSPSSTPSSSPSFIPSNNNNKGNTDSNPSVTVGISFGVLFAFLLVGGVIGRTMWQRGYITSTQKAMLHRSIMDIQNRANEWWNRYGGGTKFVNYAYRPVVPTATPDEHVSLLSPSSPSLKKTSPVRALSDARIRSLSSVSSTTAMTSGTDGQGSYGSIAINSNSTTETNDSTEL